MFYRVIIPKDPGVRLKSVLQYLSLNYYKLINSQQSLTRDIAAKHSVLKNPKTLLSNCVWLFKLGAKNTAKFYSGNTAKFYSGNTTTICADG